VLNHAGKNLISDKRVISILHLILISYNILMGTTNLRIIILKFTPLLTLILNVFSGAMLEIIIIGPLVSFIK
jgi:hypothetical protein